jgi:hypothetical protein
MAKAGATRNEDLILFGQICACGFDAGDARQAVLLANLGKPAGLQHADRRDGSALHGRLAGRDAALHATDQAYAPDDGRTANLAFHAVTGQGSDLQEVAVAIEEHLDALARKDSATREVAVHVLFATTPVGLGKCLADGSERGEIALPIGLVGLRLRIGLRTQDWVTLLGHPRES